MTKATLLSLCTRTGAAAALATACFGQDAPAVQTFALTDTKGLVAQRVTLEAVEYKGRKAVRLTRDSYDEGYAVVGGTDFQDGTIEVDIAVKVTTSPIPGMPGFAGVAFRARPDATHYELLYVRPGAASSDDQVKRNHTVQYSASPGHGWYKLRREWPWAYEAYADLEPEAWTRLKIDVAGRVARLYVNGSTKPALVVDGLRGEDLRGAVALWGYAGEETYFSNLRITNARPQPVQNGSDPSGRWEARLTTDAGAYGGLLALSRQGDQLTGTWSGAFGEGLPVSGTWRNGYVELQFAGQWTKDMPFGAPGPVVARLAGWVDGASARGRVVVAERAEGQWVASRKAE